jgi:hypothetical protein
MAKTRSLFSYFRPRGRPKGQSLESFYFEAVLVRHAVEVRYARPNWPLTSVCNEVRKRLEKECGDKFFLPKSTEKQRIATIRRRLTGFQWASLRKGALTSLGLTPGAYLEAIKVIREHEAKLLQVIKARRDSDEAKLAEFAADAQKKLSD